MFIALRFFRSSSEIFHYVKLYREKRSEWRENSKKLFVLHEHFTALKNQEFS